MRISKFATVSALSVAMAFGALQTAAVAAPAVPVGQNAPIGVKAGVIGVGAIAGSVILDAIITSATQCRELTREEAWTAGLLPVIGIIINHSKAPASKCGAAVVAPVKAKKK
ncbi:hypothetical protein [Methyloraptor flagellatus]|uniref:Uncharacterized protein n=1 Tax=Methyloraptor flagellatus TaxID=3162530 RepID=A0AAU7XBM6_9HYPH